MAYACVACPADSNVPEDFDTLPEEEKVFYVNAWAIDGNMKAEHTTPRHPGNNVQILPGTAFFPDPDDFAQATKKPFTDKSLPPELGRFSSCTVLTGFLTIKLDQKEGAVPQPYCSGCSLLEERSIQGY